MHDDVWPIPDRIYTGIFFCGYQVLLAIIGLECETDIILNGCAVNFLDSE